MADDELTHHGIKGQKWGIRRYQNEDGSLTEEGKKRYSEVTRYGVEGGTIKKGTQLYRVSIHKDDPTFDNKKYVSTSKFDNALWEDYLGGANKERGREVFNIGYKTVKDIKVAPHTEVGKKFVDAYMRNPDSVELDMVDAYEFLFRKPYDNESVTNAEAGSRLIAAQTQTGKEICKQLLSEGYGAVSDTHGTNTSYDPLIILDPDTKMKRVYSRKF